MDAPWRVRTTPTVYYSLVVQPGKAGGGEPWAPAQQCIEVNLKTIHIKKKEYKCASMLSSKKGRLGREKQPGDHLTGARDDSLEVTSPTGGTGFSNDAS